MVALDDFEKNKQTSQKPSEFLTIVTHACGMELSISHLDANLGLTTVHKHFSIVDRTSSL